MKRVLDLILASIGLALIAPVLLFAAAAIRCTSDGPAFFQQIRVGQDFKFFKILKLRTMYVDASNSGTSITRTGDPRVTPVGNYLRRLKIDELPQLFNVILGHMSLVGPRPEVPEYVNLFREDFETILTVRPGITDPASIAFRNEGDLLQNARDPKTEYLQTILPKKLELSKLYVQQASLPSDLLIIARTVIAIIFPTK